MTDRHVEIEDALARLASQDAGLAQGAEAALNGLTAGEGLEVITQEGVQRFLWYELPLKWLTNLDDKLLIADALAQLLELLELFRYAQICRSATTVEILKAYDRADGEGLTAYHKADIASGIRPPDLLNFKWGTTMGLHEVGAYSSTAEMLELAVAAGDLVPGARGWKARQQQLVQTHLDTPVPEMAGQTPKHVILTERIEQWTNTRRSEARRKLLAGVANRLLHPVPLPAGTDPMPSLRWLLDQLDGGIPLTQTGNLGQKFVQEAADRFGWTFRGLPRNEDDLFDLHITRRLAQRLRLARRDGRKLVLTTKGRSLLADPEGLWRLVAGNILPDSAFEALAGEIFFVMLLNNDQLPMQDLASAVKSVAAEEGFRDSATGDPPGDQPVNWAIGDTLRLCRVLGLLSIGGEWQDRVYGLNVGGRATALEALRARATGPRSTPWG